MEDATVRAVCDMFDLGAPRGAPRAVAGGLTNRLWRIETDRGVFAVKEMNRDADRADYVAWFDRAFALEQAAFAAGVPMPRPVPVAETGRCLAEIVSSGVAITVRAHEWVDGEKLDNGTVYPVEVVRRVGTILAQIHALHMWADAAAADALPVFGRKHWLARAEQAQSVDAELAKDLRGLLPAIAELDAYLTLAHDDTTPLLLSHRDADMKNFMHTDAGYLLLVDWDQAGPVNPRHDVANHALVWAGVHRGDPDAANARTYVDAYRRAGGDDEPFRATDLAELVSLRLGWFDFNVRRALGERVRDDADRELGANVVRRNVEQLPRFARSLEAWIVVLAL